MIYVLIPAHNEAPTVGLLLWKVRQLFTSFNREYQLIVVNDGSTDATEEVLAPYTRALPLTLLTHRKRQGYARSLEALLREAIRRTDRPRRDVAVTMQADFSEAPEDVLELIKKLDGGADVVVADRRARTGAGRAESFVRRFLPRLVSKRLGIAGADDVVGTMRGYRLGAIERLVKDAGDRPFLGHSGWAADLELLARVARHARRIESVALDGGRNQRARPSQLKPLREAWSAFRAAGALRGLPMPSAEALVEPERDVVQPKAERQGQRARAAQQHERRHAHHPPPGGKERREDRRRNERRPKSDHRPKVERPAKQQQAQRAAAQARPENRPENRPESRPEHRSESRPEAPPVATGPVLVPDAQPAGEGGQRRKRRRRGRGRGRGRGQREGQQNGAAAEAAPPPPPPPSTAPPAA